jgi:hypothetical protein
MRILPPSGRAGRPPALGASLPRRRAGNIGQVADPAARRPDSSVAAWTDMTG